MNINRKHVNHSPERELKDVKGIVIHYTANPKSSAVSNIKYLNKKGLSYHYIIDIDGTVYQIKSTKYRAIHCGSRRYTKDATRFFGERNAPSHYHTADNLHTGSPNNVTIGVCFCYEDKSGKPTDVTYEALVKLVSNLCDRYSLKYNGGIWRHFDITGKKCPLYFLDNDIYIKFLHDVANKMKGKQYE